jgi:Domain of unknown function (DUF4331)
MKRLSFALGALAAIVFASLTVIAPAFAADHGDAPLSKANHAEDLADVYAFAGDGGNLVLAMTVNPLSMPGDAPTFDQSGLYQFKIDNNGDAVPDVTYDVTFGAPAADGTQTVKVQKATGAAADTLAASGSELISGSTTAATASPKINTNGNVKLFAGLRDDPFFFDLTAFKAGLKFRNPGNDFFLGLNVSAIVLSVPPSDLEASGSTAAGVWAVTSKGGAVIDRMGRPAIATVFIPAGMKDDFNNTKPANDVATWKSTVVASLNGLGSDPKLADTLLPDILTFDTGKALHFLNGRALTDDVIDAELQLITGNSAASDNVSNDSTFLAGFPYLGSPNTSPAPTPIPVTSPAAAAPTTAPGAAPTQRTGVTAPNTGTGDGTSGNRSHTMLWVLLGVAGIAFVAVGGGAAVRSRR